MLQRIEAALRGDEYQRTSAGEAELARDIVGNDATEINAVAVRLLVITDERERNRVFTVAQLMVPLCLIFSSVVSADTGRKT